MNINTPRMGEGGRRGAHGRKAGAGLAGRAGAPGPAEVSCPYSDLRLGVVTVVLRGPFVS